MINSGNELIYQVLNVFFFIFHSVLIVFNLFGWIWRKTRRANLVVLLLTAFSWFILGIWYGFGYCPFTEWHWHVRMKLGLYDMTSSYLVFLIQSLSGLRVSRETVDTFAVLLLFLALSMSLLFNIRDWKYRKEQQSK
jgi:hypothetical protein